MCGYYMYYHLSRIQNTFQQKKYAAPRAAYFFIAPLLGESRHVVNSYHISKRLY